MEFKAKTQLSSRINTVALAYSKELPVGYRQPFEYTIMHYGKFARNRLFLSRIWKERFNTLDSFSIIEFFRLSDGLMLGYVISNNSGIINYEYHSMFPSHDCSKGAFKAMYISENERFRVEQMIVEAFKMGITNCDGSFIPVVAYKVHKLRNEWEIDVAFSCNPVK